MAKKASRKTLIKKLDTIVSKIIRTRTKLCVQCGSRENLTNGHIFSRRHHSLRWDIREDGNCHTQCWGCNYKHSYDNYDYYKWYEERYGSMAFETLRAEYRQTKKRSNVELEELYEYMKNKLKQAESKYGSI